MGEIGVGFQRRKQIPMTVVLDDGTVSQYADVVLNKWKTDFESILNPVREENPDVPQHPPEVTDEMLDQDISMGEVRDTLLQMKKGKAVGSDELPAEILHSAPVVKFLHRLFNYCFRSGLTPSEWSKGIINPIPKNSTDDARNPLSYRGITLSSSVYKLYCGILNTRLTKWAEENELIIDNQNGFRKHRSTIDHLSSITSIIETRKAKKLSTYAVFIDFKKAYDTIDRSLLWSRLDTLGISGRMLTTLKSLYSNVKCCVRVNGFPTEWFNVNIGLRQGCILSPLMFNLYLDDLSRCIRALGKGVDIGDDSPVNILLYADDIVLLAESPEDLQSMLDIVTDWCRVNKMCVNSSKTNIVHFRPPSTKQTDFCFSCSGEVLKCVDRYCYLGLILSEYLDYNITARAVSQSASRALGLIISKFKSAGGFPYEVYTKLFDSCVFSVMSYGAAIWGTREFSCINAVQNRACRFFLGVGKYTPNAAVMGDMGWTPVYTNSGHVF